MRSGGKTFIIAGVGLALVAVVLLVLAVGGGSDGNADETQDEATVTVVEALVDVPANQILTSAELVEKEVPESEVNPDSVQTVAQVVGMSYRVPLVKGQRLVHSQTQQPGLSQNIKVGYRAFSLPVNEASALSGLIADGDYVDVVFKARLNLVRIMNTTMAESPEDAIYEFSDGVGWTPPDVDQPQYPATGDTGSKFFIRDEADQLEPVAKVLLQDLRVLRVVRPGDSFNANGQRIDEALPAEAAGAEESLGYLILEVTDQQAEVLSFVQDTRHQYQVMVRAKDDHTIVNTTGVTFQVLYDGADYAVPMPRPVTAGVEPEIPTTATQSE